MCKIRPANSDGSVLDEGATLPESSTLPDPEVMPVMKAEIARHFLGLGRSAMYGFDQSGACLARLQLLRLCVAAR